ncbi:MAG: tetratricopeptide repeat protein [Emcibacteraceae bacterium]|nr:tetratricopeptide repeat protein [Emcibacteraceae bacterium]
MFNIIKNIPSVIIFFAFCLLATISNAQQLEPWLGAVVGETIHLGNDNRLSTVRRLINEGNTEGAVREAKKLVTTLKLSKMYRASQRTRYRYNIYNALCISLTSNNEYEDALAACNEAIDSDPHRWHAINSRGSLNYKMGNYTKALTDYQRALNKAPERKRIKRIIEHNIKISEARISN